MQGKCTSVMIMRHDNSSPKICFGGLGCSCAGGIMQFLLQSLIFCFGCYAIVLV